MDFKLFLIHWLKILEDGNRIAEQLSSAEISLAPY